MTDGTASLRRQIGSAAELRSVVRAMKAQAAASVGQYQKSVDALGDYARTVDQGLGVCFRQSETRHVAPPPHATTRGAKGTVLRAVVFGSDQGLVGRFNDIVLALAQQSLAALHGTPQLWAVGERLRAAVGGSGMPLSGVFPVPRSVGAIATLVGKILVEVVEASEAVERPGSTVELHLFYNRPTTGAEYEPVGQRLLPLDDAWRRGLIRQSGASPGTVPDILGSRAATLRALIREYLFVSLFRACAESLASENSSRLAAMERADRNIDKMLVRLNNGFHKMRQTAIDEELSDVVAGFKALHSEG